MLTSKAHKLDAAIRTTDIFINEDVTFEGLILSEPTLSGLSTCGFERPSPIQFKAIPFGKCGFDLIAQAKSGTGKTCMFGVIVLEMLQLPSKSLQVLILAPTREIAIQVADVITAIGQGHEGLKVVTVIGGLPVEDDRRNIRGCHILVATPGRLCQLLKEGNLNVSHIRMLVLDEADKLLDPSFLPDVSHILSLLPEKRQTLASSATYTEDLKEFLEKIMRSPIRINPDSFENEEISCVLLGVRQCVALIDFHPVITARFQRKFKVLTTILSTVPFKQCLVFNNMHAQAESMSQLLIGMGWPTQFISAHMDQYRRLRAITALVEFQCRVLLSTDLSARGLDAANVDLVINLDIPNNPATYLHRVGRAGRFGTRGLVITICENEGKDYELLRKIAREMRVDLRYFCVKLNGPVPIDLLDCSLPSLDDYPPDKTKADETEMNGHEDTKTQKIDKNLKQSKNEIGTETATCTVLQEISSDMNEFKNEKCMKTSINSELLDNNSDVIELKSETGKEITTNAELQENSAVMSGSKSTSEVITKETAFDTATKEITKEDSILNRVEIFKEGTKVERKNTDWSEVNMKIQEMNQPIATIKKEEQHIFSTNDEENIKHVRIKETHNNTVISTETTPILQQISEENLSIKKVSSDSVEESEIKFTTPEQIDVNKPQKESVSVDDLISKLRNLSSRNVLRSSTSDIVRSSKPNSSSIQSSNDTLFTSNISPIKSVPTSQNQSYLSSPEQQSAWEMSNEIVRSCVQSVLDSTTSAEASFSFDDHKYTFFEQDNKEDSAKEKDEGDSKEVAIENKSILMKNNELAGSSQFRIPKFMFPVQNKKYMNYTEAQNDTHTPYQASINPYTSYDEIKLRSSLPQRQEFRSSGSPHQRRRYVFRKTLRYLVNDMHSRILPPQEEVMGYDKLQKCCDSYVPSPELIRHVHEKAPPQFYIQDVLYEIHKINGNAVCDTKYNFAKHGGIKKYLQLLAEGYEPETEKFQNACENWQRFKNFKRVDWIMGFGYEETKDVDSSNKPELLEIPIREKVISDFSFSSDCELETLKKIPQKNRKKKTRLINLGSNSSPQPISSCEEQTVTAAENDFNALVPEEGVVPLKKSMGIPLKKSIGIQTDKLTEFKATYIPTIGAATQDDNGIHFNYPPFPSLEELNETTFALWKQQTKMVTFLNHYGKYMHFMANPDLLTQ